jgi:hypothetical protein
VTAILSMPLHIINTYFEVVDTFSIIDLLFDVILLFDLKMFNADDHFNRSRSSKYFGLSSWPVSVTVIKTAPSIFLSDLPGILYVSVCIDICIDRQRRLGVRFSGFFPGRSRRF